MKEPTEIILRPILTEKSVAQTAQRKYTFAVALDANKVEIRRAIEQLFDGARVARVHTMVVRGKQRRMGGYRRRASRVEGRTSSWKKAIVTLSEGTIPAFEGL